MNIQNNLDKIYAHVAVSYESSKSVKILDLIDDLQDEIDNLK